METLVTAIITTYPDIPPRAMCPWPGIAPSLPAITKKIFISDTEQDQRPTSSISGAALCAFSHNTP